MSERDNTCSMHPSNNGSDVPESVFVPVRRNELTKLILARDALEKIIDVNANGGIYDLWGAVDEILIDFNKDFEGVQDA